MGHLQWGMLGGCDRRKAGHSQESIGSAVLLLEGLEIRTGSEIAIHHDEDHKDAELLIHEMELLIQICSSRSDAKSERRT